MPRRGRVVIRELSPDAKYDSMLVTRLVNHPAMRVRGVVLGTPTMREFYQSVGFQCVNDQAFFMVLVRDEFGEGLILPVDVES